MKESNDDKKDFNEDFDSKSVKRISVELAEALYQSFPDAVGRDIEKLVKLTARFSAKKKIKPDLSDFIHCAAFRDMIPVNSV